jgi:sulfur carrier protein
MSVTPSTAVATGAFEVLVNDRARSVAAGATVLSLLTELGLVARKGVAVAVNDGVVGRSQWPTRTLQPSDRVLIIQATQGG